MSKKNIILSFLYFCLPFCCSVCERMEPASRKRSREIISSTPKEVIDLTRDEDDHSPKRVRVPEVSNGEDNAVICVQETIPTLSPVSSSPNLLLPPRSPSPVDSFRELEWCPQCIDYSPDTECVLTDGLESIFEGALSKNCTKKGACSVQCTNACRRFNCYGQSAKYLGLIGRTKLPLCVQKRVKQMYK
jgi:hypothetical protein